MAKRKRAKPVLAGEWRRLHLRGVPSKVLADAEVHAFIEAQLKTPVTFAAIARASLERFGAERAPGKSSIHRYWQMYHQRRAQR